MNISNRSIIVAVVLSIAFVLGLGWASSNFKAPRTKAKEITVTGSAEKHISSDVVVWSATFEVPPTLDIKQAYRTIAANRATLESFLAAKGVPSDAITFESILITKDINYIYRDAQQQNVFNGYQLHQDVRIVSKDIDLIEQVSREISTLIDQGLYIISRQPQYYYSHLEESKHEFLEMASQDALKRAEAIASGSHKELGSLLRSQMGVFQIVGQYTNEDYSWGGNFNTSSREKTITVTVRSSYSLR